MADDQMVPILFCRYSDEFEELAWSSMLAGPFEVTNPLQSMMMEAGAKGMSVVINVSLVPTDILFPMPDELPPEDSDTESVE